VQFKTIKMLLKRVKYILSPYLNAMDMVLITICSKHGFLAYVYYTFFNRAFFREQKSVLSGRASYWRSHRSLDSNNVILRRNIHRLEKGLIMRPRKTVFAQAYIQETVDLYRNAVLNSNFDQNELKWANDVLTEYFSVVSDSEIISLQKTRFHEYSFTGQKKCKPYSYAELGDVGVSYDDLHSLFMHRRSVRWFLEKEVPIDLIHKAVTAATLAPSACNRQPFKFFVLNSKVKAAQAAKLAGGAAGFADNLQCLIVIVGELDSYPKEHDRHLIYIDGALVSMQLMLALETLGLATCAINWPDTEMKEKKMQSLLKLPDSHRPVMLLAVGYADPAGGVPYSQKKGSDALIKDISR
jgi:nitroreductase